MKLKSIVKGKTLYVVSTTGVVKIVCKAIPYLHETSTHTSCPAAWYIPIQHSIFNTMSFPLSYLNLNGSESRYKCNRVFDKKRHAKIYFKKLQKI